MNRQTKLVRVTWQPGDAVVVPAAAILKSVKVKQNTGGGSGGRAVLVWEVPVTVKIQIDKSGRRRQH